MKTIEVKNLKKNYQLGDLEVNALRGVSFDIDKGQFSAIMGPSGSGKSTLMHIIGCLDSPTSGEYLLNGKNVAKMSEDQLASIRNKDIGFVFQKFHLLPRSTALENVILPLKYAKVDKNKRIDRAKAHEHGQDVHRFNSKFSFPLDNSEKSSERVATDFFSMLLLNNPRQCNAVRLIPNFRVEFQLNSLLELQGLIRT